MPESGGMAMRGEAALEAVTPERVQALLDHSWDILSLLDHEGRLIYNSPAAQHLHGFTPEEMADRNTFEFFHPEDVPKVTEVFQACLHQPGQPVRVEYRYACRDGSWIWMEAVAVNLLENPSVRAIVVNSRDISERRKAQAALQASEQFADRIIDTLPDILAVLDGQGRILKVNQAWRDFARAKGGSDVFRGGANYLEAFEQVGGLEPCQLPAMTEGLEAVLRGERHLFTFECSTLFEEGVRWFRVHLTRIQGAEPACLVASHIDITSLKAAEEQRLQLERLLHRSQKMESLGSLAGGVAHEMNNVLASILGMASMHQEIQPPGTAVHHAFSIITKASIRGGGVVRRLLDFSRQSLAEVASVDLNLLIQEEMQLLERTTLAQVSFASELDPELRPILGDATALVHVLMNLSLNAIDAMPMGGCLTLRTRNASPDWVELDVEDTGTGMSQEVMERAMDPFFTTKPVGKGTGLGLSIVYSTIKAHQGTVELQSERGHGTLVRLRLPAFPAIPPRAVSSQAPIQETGHRGLDILLVDDDELILATQAPVIECLGHRVSLARSGEQALKQLESGYRPQVVILDLNMPGLGGQGTLPRLRELQPDVPVLLATGCVDEASEALTRAFAKVKLLAKPFSMTALRQHLDGVAPQ
ncbi:PAS domain S-box protein [Geothrix sp. PMB-07]|uniref:hybrid sensor histidine kinase/response regulator n=1 Tax=Geothrix sp. PMB-07 TaxID=3068640 RepID=UPI002740E905|nr:PAS domain S-box protein [Geothrix sp. PMB-07]WLT31984.1 PAS domain S-box protein [Geothrix sp. PMB-07]